MCFSKAPQVETPAAAPAAPAAPAIAQDVGNPRKAEDTANYGSTSPDLRVRSGSLDGGGVGGLGSGLKM